MTFWPVQCSSALQPHPAPHNVPSSAIRSKENAGDLNQMSLQELKRLQRDLERAIASFEQRQLAAARAELEARARELGFSLAELVSADGGTAKSKRAAAQPRYRNPANPEETWSGRGR